MFLNQTHSTWKKNQTNIQYIFYFTSKLFDSLEPV